MSKETKATLPATSILSHKIRPFNYLLNSIEDEHPDLKIPKHALLIGAGCSWQCGIPLGGEIIALCQAHAFLKQNVLDSKKMLQDCRTNSKEIEKRITDKGLDKAFNSFIKEREKQIADGVAADKEAHLERLKRYLKIKDDEWQQKAEAVWNQYKDAIVADNGYGFWMNQYSEDTEERQRFIEDIMDNKDPDGAYIILSYLIEKRKFTNILTTNFDDLINEAVMYYTAQRCRFYVDDELSQYISIHNKKPNIVKLHGDYRFANMKNTAGETDRLTNNIGLKLQELLRHIGLIVVGYNGADYSIMNVLQEFKGKYKYPLIWCGMDAAKVHWRVAHLINKTENSFFVEIKGFDWLMGKLAIQFLSNVPDIEQKAKEKKKVVDVFLEKFKINFGESGGSPKEVAELDKTIDIWAERNEARKNKDYSKLIEIETKIIESGKGDQFDYGWRGDAYVEFENFNKAIEDYNKAIELDPEHVISYNNRGYVYGKLKEYQKSIEDLDKSIELDPNNVVAYRNRGDAYDELKNYQKAIEDYKKAIELNPNYVIVYNNRGYIYNVLGEYQKALEDLNKAIELDPGFVAAYNNRGLAYNSLKQYQKAIEDCNKAVKLDPNYTNAYKHRGVAYTALKQYEAAQKDLDQAIALKPDYWEAYEARADLYEEMGDADKAAADRAIAAEIKKEKNITDE